MKQREDELKRLMDLLDEKLAAGEIDEVHYDTLRKKYESELEKVRHEKFEEELLAEAEFEKRERGEKMQVINCPNCQREIPQDAQVCPYCGTTILPYFVPGKHTYLGLTSMILGIISVVFWFIPLLIILFSDDWTAQELAFVWLLLFPLPMSILDIIFGSIAYYSKAQDNYGLVGFRIGVIILVSIIFILLWAEGVIWR